MEENTVDSVSDRCMCSPYLHGKDPSDTPGYSYPLVCHLLDTLVVADALWAGRVRSGLRARIAGASSDASTGLLGESAARAAALYAAALHDIGKINPFFQFQDRVPSTASRWADQLSAALDLPRTHPAIRSFLLANSAHALRRHEFISYRALEGTWARSETPIASSNWIGAVAGGHHGHWRTIASPDEEFGEYLLREGWVEAQSATVALVDAVVEQLTGVRRKEIPGLLGRDAALAVVVVSGLITQADWIASNDDQVAEGKRVFLSGMDPTAGVTEALAWVSARGPSLAAHIERSLGHAGSLDPKALTEQILGDFSPRPLQEQAIVLADETSTQAGDNTRDDTGLWVVMYPTGDGKTEASGLRHALCAQEGLIFGLPTRATTDAMESRVSAWFDPLGALVVKSHQFAELGARSRPHDSDDEEGRCGSALWYTGGLRKLAAPNVIATCDQVLAGALSQRHIAMRLFHLANHHVILDEVHTYDTYQTELLVELLYWWGATGTRVTLLSATLPRDQLERMAVAYRRGCGAPEASLPETTFPGSLFVPASSTRPAVALAPRAGRSRSMPCVDIALAFASDRHARVKSHVSWVETTATSHPDSPIGVVSNTVGDCIEIATLLASDPSVTRTHDVLCMHSSMVNMHRALRERDILAALGKDAHQRGFDSADPHRRPVVVVGTQVIQASLDIDFDFISSDLAPAPDLIQRLGREWRFVQDAAAVPTDRILRSGSDRRAFRIVCVCEEDQRTVTFAGAVPYLMSTLQNTLSWLLERGCEQPLDVIAESQSWVDRSYERRLLSEIPADEVPEPERPRFALDRVAQDARHVIEASNSKAQIAPSTSGRGLLRSPGASGLRRTPVATWGDLESITQYDIDEARMRTRFIDYESEAILLFDEDGRVGPLGVRDEGHEARLGRIPRDIELLSPAPAAELLDLSVRVPASLNTLIEAAARATLGKDPSWSASDWRPQAKVLASTLPVDLKHMPGATYSALTGLSATRGGVK